MAPIEAFAHPEIWVELMVNAELDRASIQQPVLVTCRVPRNVKRVTRTVGMNHQRRYSSRNYAQIWVCPRNNVAWIGVTDRNRVRSGVAACTRRDCGCRSRIKNLPSKNRAAQGVLRDLVRGQQRAEIACLERINRRGVSKSRQNA